ncbi:MAG: capsule assembly Wzi family protein [Bacteroidales bacterium]|nr:capsule assembly Wzi family protein [Bacteroidales bacterium]
MTVHKRLSIPYIVVFWAIILISSSAFSQGLKMPDYSLETGASFSTGNQTPFWLLSNQYGLLTPNKFNGWAKAGIHTSLSKKNIGYDYRLELINRYSNKNELYVQQAYLRLKLYFVTIQAGSMEETYGNQDGSLSCGGLLWSGNARPMPKISILVPDFTKIPFTFDLLEFKGGISHGWFGDEPIVNNAWLHHKFGYIQFGGKLPVHIHYGFHHFAQWAGKTNDGVQLPNTWDDFKKVFLVQSGGNGSPVSDSLNALGNHIGSRNFGIDIDLHKIKMGLYWQTIFEDGSGKAYRNIKDGLWGFYLHTKDKNKLVNGFVYEFINTTDQSGPAHAVWVLDGKEYSYPIPGGEYHQLGGNDDYFNNEIYLFGWTFKNMTLGTPFITSPVIAVDGQGEYMRNNKVTGHHFGIEGILKDISYKIFYTYYLNFGTNSSPFSPNKPQHSILLQTYFSNKLPWGIDLSLKGGIDIGSMYGDNLGIQISLIKTGSF